MANRPKIAVIGLSGQSVFMSVGNFHENEETLHCRSLFEEPGGKGYNQAVAASRLGADVAFLSALGEDPYAGVCRARLVAENITDCCVIKRGRTALAVILVNDAGDNRVTVYPGTRLTASDVTAFNDHIANSDILLLQLEVPAEVNELAITYARRHGVKVILNPAPVLNLTDKILDGSWLITPNRHEAERIDLSRAPRAIVTLGAEGAKILAGDKSTHVRAPHVTAVNTTGAGDVFTAAVAVATAKGLGLIKAAEFACAAAALKVSRPYLLDGIPFAHELDMLT